MDQALGTDGWLHHQRESWVWMADRFIPYPFQNNLHRLPPDLRWKCVQGLLSAAAKSTGDRPIHFRAWINQTFGQGIADVFLIPYNIKVWAHPLDTLNATWVGERISVPPMERVLKAVCLEQDDVSWGPNNTFRFPKRGGTGAAWRALCGQLPTDRVRLGVAVSHVDVNSRQLYLSDGTRVGYVHLVSTMPLDIMARMVGEPSLESAAAHLPYSSTHVVGVGLRGSAPAHLRTKCWVYFPERNCPFYRVTLFSNYSPDNVPDPASHWSLMAEVAESVHKPVDSTTVVKETVEGMVATRLIESPSDVLCTWHRRLDHGYPTPGLRRDQALSVLLPGLERYGIYSRGRFGAWKYEVSNQDHSYAQGQEVIDRLVDRVDSEGGVEPTLNRPDWVNGRRNQ